MNFNRSNITIGGMIIHNEDHLGGVSIGINHMIGRGVAGKKNQGFGQHSADQATIFAPVHVVVDNDEMDFPTIIANW